MQGTDASGPVVAEEAMEDAGKIEAGDDETPEVWNQRDGGRRRLLRRRGMKVRWGVRHGWGGDGDGALEGEGDVDEGGDGKDGRRLLRVCYEVAMAGLVLRVPLEDIELEAHCFQ